MNEKSLLQSRVYKECNLGIVDPPCADFYESPKEFSKESRRAYVFTTENIAKYIEELDIKDKRIACVTGSADFALNAYLYGAASVVGVDICPVACFVSELKTLGLLLFDYDEFLNFFATNGIETFGPHSFAYKPYLKLRDQLSLEAKAFFDLLITEKGRADVLAPDQLIIDKITSMQFIKEYNPYLQSKSTFEAAKKALKPTLFYPLGIKEFLHQRKESFDLVHLSNIFVYPPCSSEKPETMQAAIDSIVVGGKIVIYCFTSPSNLWVIDEFQKKWEKMGVEGKQVIGPVGYTKGVIFSLLILKKVAQTYNL